MTYSTVATTSIGLSIYYIEDGTKVRLELGSAQIDLDDDQRAEVAAFLSAGPDADTASGPQT